MSAQLFVNNNLTPIDDLSAPWPVAWQSIGTLFVDAQDVWSSSTKAAMCEQVSFHPYQTLVENQPQGWVQAIRNIVMSREQFRRHVWNAQPQADWTMSTLNQYIVSK